MFCFFFSHSIRFLGLLHISVVCSFVLLRSILLYEYNTMFFQSPVDGYLDYLQFLAKMSKILMIVLAQSLRWIYVFISNKCRCIAELYGRYSFLGNYNIVSQVVCNILPAKRDHHEGSDNIMSWVSNVFL